MELSSVSFRRLVPACAAAAAVVLVVSCSSDVEPSAEAVGRVGELPAAAAQIMDKPAYRGARWIYQVADQDTGEVLFSSRPDELAFTGSTAKLFTVGTLFDSRGTDAKLTTPVYTTGPVADGTLDGDLVLVGSGDLTFGGREASAGKAVDAFSATTIDHVYADIAPNGAVPAGDPLAGVNRLAAQVAASGIRQVNGDVLVDDRLWQPYTAQEGPVPPIFVNDNLLDITVDPGAVGATAGVTASPATAAYRTVSEVTTKPGTDVSLAVTADEHDPRLLHVSGEIGADAGKRLTIYRVPDAAAWARTLFTEALARAGVAVSGSAASGSATSGSAGPALPAPDSYGKAVATYVSPPLSVLAGMVLRTSYNTGANAFLCLNAVQAGATDCTDGLKSTRTLAGKAGIDDDALILVDGQGGDPASASPATMTRWIRFADGQPWGPALREDLPILGETGTLAANGLQSPAKGKVRAKTGTSAHVDPATGRALFNVQSMAGHMTSKDDRRLVFDVLVSGAVFDDPVSGVTQVGDDVADVAAAFQQAAQ
ncbi:MAG: D-alanyl-D-alanine carboxypeptidase/D-alanyl-D-alanine-endopeptidase [Gordonia sp. (in: high G+C Gram-positive bacteria)]|uniref:D-alanyl-D-alanine carboxypeptidase/D-alanyl-D-alanine endopeptidase n=1 Tax=Gordonia sp. (in: high G+C Gram-positive bacteria) TaxID=84139 RepID=UPI003C763642